MLDLNASIEPGKAAAGLALGDPVATLSQAGQLARHQLGDGHELLDFGSVRVWAKDGVIDQIGVLGGYTGRVGGTAIGIGSTIQQVVDAIGAVVEDDEDNLTVPAVAGLCFETEVWRDGGRGTVEENLDAKLTEIFVFAVRAS